MENDHLASSVFSRRDFSREGSTGAPLHNVRTSLYVWMLRRRYALL